MSVQRPGPGEVHGPHEHVDVARQRQLGDERLGELPLDPVDLDLALEAPQLAPQGGGEQAGHPPPALTSEAGEQRQLRVEVEHERPVPTMTQLDEAHCR